MTKRIFPFFCACVTLLMLFTTGCDMLSNEHTETVTKGVEALSEGTYNDVPTNEIGEETAEEAPSFESGNTEASEAEDSQSPTDTNIEDVKTSYSTQELVETLELSNIFASVLNNETKVYGWKFDSWEYIHLQDFIIGPVINFAYVSSIDLDKNGVNDVVVLQCLDMVVVLREHEENVYAWQYGHRAFYNLRTDGTYSWHAGAGDIYGTNQLQFHGIEMNSHELDRVEYNERFYVNGTEVSYDAFQAYIQNEELAEEAIRYQWITGFEISD